MLSTFLFSEDKLSVLCAKDNGIVAHSVNLNDGSVEKTGESHVKAFGVSQTSNFFAVVNEEGKTVYLKPSDLSEVASAMLSQSSAADDVIIDGTTVVNLADNKRVEIPSATADCNDAVRQQGFSSAETSVKLVHACNDFLEIKSVKAADNSFSSDAKTSEISLRKNGGVTQMWHNVRHNNELVYLIQMQDMSLHMLQGMPEKQLSVSWSRQEGLSAIKQMEVLEQAENEAKVHSQFDYIKSWTAPVSIAEVPVRIIQRYTENINSAVRYIMNAVQKAQDGEIISG